MSRWMVIVNLAICVAGFALLQLLFMLNLMMSTMRRERFCHWLTPITRHHLPLFKHFCSLFTPCYTFFLWFWRCYQGLRIDSHLLLCILSFFLWKFHSNYSSAAVTLFKDLRGAELLAKKMHLEGYRIMGFVEGPCDCCVRDGF